MASTSVRPAVEPRPGGPSRARIWAPFAIGFIGGGLALLFESRIGQFLGIYSPLLGYAAVDVYAGVVIAFVAALASRTWLGLWTFVLGLLALGAVIGVPHVPDSGPGAVVGAALYIAFLLGLLGVPTYAIVTIVVNIIRLTARALRPRERPD